MTAASTTCTFTDPSSLKEAGKPVQTVSRFAATASRTDGEGTRLAWIDPAPKSGAEVRRTPSFHGVTTAYLRQAAQSQ